MVDFGISASDYTPSQPISGIIGKIAKQVVEGMDTPEKFDIFDKEPIEEGKDVEISVYENATGVAYNKNGQNVIPNPKNHTLYFTEYDEKTYTAFIDKWNIDKASKDMAYAEKSAGVIVETLYGGDRDNIRAQNYAQLAAAVAGVPTGDGSVQIVTGGSISEVKDEATAQAALAAIKLTAAGMREEPEAFNPYALPKVPRELALLIPYQTKVKIDVYARSKAEDNVYLEYGVDHVITIPASKTEGAIYIVDMRYFQNRRRRSVYEEYPVQFSGGNVKAGLTVSRMFALCPLFGAVKLPQAAEPVEGKDVAAAAMQSVTEAQAKNAEAAAKVNAARAARAATASSAKSTK